MAKEKSAEKSSHKKSKSEKKEKRSEKDGVHKSKKDKSEKKPVPVPETEGSDVDVDVAPVAQPLVEKLANGNTMKKETENGEMEIDIKAKPAPLVGALVPFANPLADEKVGKKVLKSVKKGEILLSYPHCPTLYYANTNYSHFQPPKTNRSNAASKRSSNHFVNPPRPQHPPPPLRPESSFWLRISRQWM